MTKKPHYTRKNILKESQVVRAKLREKEYLLGDGGGLFLRVRPDGGKDWLFGYTFGGKRQKMGLGSAHHIGLTTARLEAERARNCIISCVCPKMDRARRVADESALKEAYLLVSKA